MRQSVRLAAGDNRSTCNLKIMVYLLAGKLDLSLPA
jgi:hypothetical protein